LFALRSVVGNTTPPDWIKGGASTARVDGSDKSARLGPAARAARDRWANWPTPCRGV